MPEPKKNVAYEFYSVLIDRATGQFKIDPTIATGDFKVSIDGGALANLTTTPTVSPSGSALVKINLSQSEMNGNKINIQVIDQAGAEWSDVHMFIDTSIVIIDDVPAATWSEIMEGSYDASDMMRIMCAAMSGKISGAATTGVTIRNITDTNDIVQATVDANGNRSSVTLDP